MAQYLIYITMGNTPQEIAVISCPALQTYLNFHIL